MDARHRVRSGGRQRRQLPRVQPLPRHRHGEVREPGARHPEEVRGHHVGEDDRGRPHGPRAVRGHRRDPQRPELEGPTVRHGAGRSHLPADWASDPGRVAFVLQLGHGPGCDRAGAVRTVAPSASVPQRLRDEFERQLLAVQPAPAAHRLRAHHRRREHGAQPAHADRADHDPGAGGPRRLHSPGHAEHGVQRPPVRG